VIEAILDDRFMSSAAIPGTLWEGRNSPKAKFLA
jgi:hypothetical protein